MPDNLIALVTPVSPILGRALSGPNAALVARLLGKEVLDSDTATIDNIYNALKAMPPDGQLAKIMPAQGNFLGNQTAMQIELARCLDTEASHSHTLMATELDAANDRASARQNQQTTNDRTNAFLAYIVTVGFLLTILLVARFNFNGATNPALQTLLGILGTGWASMMAFFFGSSVGSREKTAILGEANTPPKTTNVGGQPNAGGNG